MRIDKRSRAELKQYFVKNAIPTESNFAELIEGMLIQRDDGIAKLPNDPLSIEAAGDDAGQKKAIHFYNSFSDANPTWVLSLNPRQDPANAATARAGFSISDGAGTSRLFVDRGTGNVGVATIAPRAALHVDRGATNNLGLMVSSSGAGWGSGLQLENTAAGAAKTFGIYTGGGALHFADVSASADRMLITRDGDVGIGVTPSGAKLQVAGTVRANRFTSDNALALNDYTTVNPTSNVYLSSPAGDRDAWLYLDSADTTANWGIYHRQLNDAVKGLPGNSIGFVGRSKLQAYIRLEDGSAFFAGPVGIGTTAAPRGRLDVPTGDAYVGRMLNISAESDGTNAGVLNFVNATNTKHWHVTHRSGEADKLIFWRNDASTYLATLKLGMDGVVETPNGALIHAIGIGTQTYGKTSWPYETIQMAPTNNLRIWFGTNERFIFGAGGYLQALSFRGAAANWNNLGSDGTVMVDNVDYKSMMIVGSNQGQGKNRWVRLWDYLTVHGGITADGEVEALGAFVRARGAGNELTYFGGDGGGSDVQIGSTNPGIMTVIAYNTSNGAMDFICRRLTQTSDERLKRNIEPLSGALDKVTRLRGVWFNWTNQPADTPQPRDLGLIAQEVKAVLPEAVTEGRGGHLAISYQAVTVLLLEAVKEQQAQIDELRGALKEQRAARKKGQ